MVETPSMHVQRPEWTNHIFQDAIAGSITPVTCVICEAIYAPSHHYKRFLRGSPVVLESAYMSMCHFCFRCRRPACPECWDAVHSICGACVQEANLSFRTQVKPLDGILFPPTSPASSTSQVLPIEPADPQGGKSRGLPGRDSDVAGSHFKVEATQENTASSLFICVKHGKFYPLVLPADTISNIQTIETATVESTESTGKPLEPQPSTLQVQEQPTPGIAMSLEDSLDAGLVPALDAAPDQKDAPVKRSRSTAKKIEFVLIVIQLLVLLAIAIVIGLAEYFPAVNTFIDHLLHIDIRAEIAYLLHLVQQLL